MRIDIITLFPGMFRSVLSESIIKRAQEFGRVEIKTHDLRRWTRDKHRTADDKPFGGGPGMVMKPEPIFEAVSSLRTGSAGRVVLLSPQGRKFDQKLAGKFARYKHLILICGHYEGVDERVRKYLATDEISIGDYILTCGELPAMVLIDSIVRLIPDVLGHEDSVKFESFEKGLLEYPQYTRPADYKGMNVPKVLLSGDHKKIKEWRGAEALKRTGRRRPDLLLKRRRKR